MPCGDDGTTADYAFSAAHKARNEIATLTRMLCAVVQQQVERGEQITDPELRAWAREHAAHDARMGRAWKVQP